MLVRVLNSGFPGKNVATREMHLRGSSQSQQSQSVHIITTVTTGYLGDREFLVDMFCHTGLSYFSYVISLSLRAMTKSSLEMG